MIAAPEGLAEGVNRREVGWGWQVQLFPHCYGAFIAKLALRLRFLVSFPSASSGQDFKTKRFGGLRTFAKTSHI
ncbi:MAG: hypothetical protein AB8F78_07180 [Saprospiraceae bacterium]